MVSLKSFKLINEGERDEASSSNSHWQESINQNRPSFSTTTSEGTEVNIKQYAINQQSSDIMSNISSREDSIENKNKKPIMSRDTGEAHIDGSKQMSNTRASKKSIVKVSLPDRTTNNVDTNSTIRQDNESDDQTVSPSTSSISIVVVNHDIQVSNRTHTTSDEEFTQDGSSNQSIDDLDDNEDQTNHSKINRSSEKPVEQLGRRNYFNSSATENSINHSGLLNPENLQLYAETMKGNESRLPANNEPGMAIAMNGEHFEIVWSNLSYRIEPKWYKKINFLDRIFSHFLPGQTIDNHSSATSTASSSAGMNDNQHQMHTSTNADSHLNSSLSPKQKSALDSIEIFTNLNGTIKSGQMTAVLGPSGK